MCDTASNNTIFFIILYRLMIYTGSSGLFMGGFAHRLFFRLAGQNGFIEISKTGITSYSYKCVVENRLIGTGEDFTTDAPQQIFTSIPSVSN